MKARRRFSAEFKTKVVLQLLSGEKSNAELCREHRITAQMLGNWKRHFLSHASSVFESGVGDRAESERVADLERMVGKLTMELEVAKKASSILGLGHERNGRSA